MVAVYVYNCRLTNGEMFSTEYDFSETEKWGKGVARINSKNIMVEEYGEEEKVSRNDIIYNQALEETTLTKKEFKAYMKQHLKAVIKSMTEGSETDEDIATFKKTSMAFFKFVMANFDDFTLYDGPNK